MDGWEWDTKKRDKDQHQEGRRRQCRLRWVGSSINGVVRVLAGLRKRKDSGGMEWRGERIRGRDEEGTEIETERGRRSVDKWMC